jgi:hypothetical protein
MMKCTTIVTAAFLAAAAGQALAQPVIDGSLAGDEGFYGSIRWVQNQPTSFGDNTATDPCTEDVSDAPNVVTGIEMVIPLSSIGSPAGAFTISGFINSGGHDFVSNQVVGGLNNIDDDNLGEPRNLDLSAIAGDQFVTVSATAGGTPVIDGILDSGVYGTALFTQGTATGFGDNDDAGIDLSNGSEIDQLYAVTDGTNLYLFFTGNLKTQWDKLDLFFDTTTGGQNQLRGDNPDVDFNGLNRMGDDGSGNGLIFDAGFEADFYLNFTTGNDPAETYANFAEILTGGGGSGDWSGPGGTGTNTLVGVGMLAGMEFGLDNSNVGGVTMLCPPDRPSRDWSVGSEIDGLYAYVDTTGNTLYLLVTGNLENNGNKLNLFFDVQPGGQSPLRGDNVDISFNGLNRMGEGEHGDPPVMMPGLAFDADFAADWWVNINNNVNPFVNYADSAVLRTDGPLKDFSGNHLDYGAFDGGLKTEHDPINFDGPRVDIQDGFTPNLFCNYGPRLTQLDPANPIDELIVVAIDNSNVAGVTDTDVTDAGNVTTGVEIAIDLDELGWDGLSDIRVAGFLASGDFSFVSNQVFGGLPTADNLEEVALIDMSTITGDQFVNLSGTACPPDWNGDTVLNSSDFIAFLNDFVIGNADYNGDTTTNSSDFIAFLNDFVAGC